MSPSDPASGQLPTPPEPTRPAAGPTRAIVRLPDRSLRTRAHPIRTGSRRVARHAAHASGQGARTIAVATGRAITSDRTKSAANTTARTGGTLAIYAARVTGLGLMEMGRGLGWAARQFLPIEQPLLRDPTFRIFWLSRIFVQMAQGAMLYALFILVVDMTGSSFATAIFVNCSIVPAIIFGIPGGIVSDSLPRRPVMVGLNLTRFVMVAAVVLVQPSLAGVFALTLAIWVMHQFYSPIESTVVASLVPADKVPNAQALHNLALTLAQALGLILLAPLVLRFFGVDVLFAICAALFFAAAGFTALLPRLDDHLAPDAQPADPTIASRNRTAERMGRRPGSLASSVRWFLNGWRMVSRDRVALGAVLDDMMVGFGLSALLVILPKYLVAVLDTPRENTTFVFAPAAIGLVVGLRAAPALNLVFPNRYIATAGLILFSFTVLAFGYVRQVTDFSAQSLHFPVDQISNDVGISPYVLVVMLFSIPAGFASALVGVAARSVLLSRIVPNARGQVIASQNLFQSLVTLIPTLIVGIAADSVGVQVMAVAIGLILLGSALIAHITFTSSFSARIRPASVS